MFAEVAPSLPDPEYHNILSALVSCAGAPAEVVGETGTESAVARGMQQALVSKSCKRVKNQNSSATITGHTDNLHRLFLILPVDRQFLFVCVCVV